jgi:AcrR family transcriptional regulator
VSSELRSGIARGLAHTPISAMLTLRLLAAGQTTTVEFGVSARGRSQGVVYPGPGKDDARSRESGSCTGSVGCSKRPSRATGSNGRRKPVAAKKGRGSTQRERLLAGMVATAARDGYARVSVSRVIAEAGVSRPTFYEYFADKDDCFLAALTDVQDRLLREVRVAVESRDPRLALTSAVAALLDFATADTEQAQFLTGQAMSAGPRALDTRDAGIVQIEQVIHAAFENVHADERWPDVSPRVVIGGLHRLLASLLRRGEPDLSGLITDLSSWIKSYERPAGDLRWTSLQPRTLRAPPPPPLIVPSPPEPLPPGNTGLSKKEVTANHRERLRYAAAQLAEEKGYNATTVADITKLAGVDGRAFYTAFADKQDAFMAAHEFGAKQVMEASATGFFTGKAWPERVWEGGRAFAAFLEINPLIGHVGFVEAYAVGPAAVQRVEDSHLAFTIFLQEGYQYDDQPRRPPRLTLDAVITSIFEVVYLQTRCHRQPDIAGMLGHTSFLALAPFLGADEAAEFVERQLVPDTAGT